MLAKKTFNTDPALPTELQEKAHILAGELAWPPSQALQAVRWLEKHGYEVAGIELWQEKEAKPLWIGSSDFSPLSSNAVTLDSAAECAYQAALFITKHQDYPGALFNITWDPNPVKQANENRFQNHSRVRLTTENYRAQGASCFDLGHVVEVYPDNKYEVEFSGLDGITTAQIVADGKELQFAPPTFAAPKPNVNAPRLNAEPIKEQQK